MYEIAFVLFVIFVAIDVSFFGMCLQARKVDVGCSMEMFAGSVGGQVSLFVKSC